VLSMRRVIAAAGGARLCYGKPVQAGDRVVIPVARVRAAGGFGSGEDDHGGGGGGGGAIDAAPVGFIEVTPQGTRFESIPDPAGTATALRHGAAAAGALLAAVAAFRQQRRGTLPSPRRLLQR
jgi:uncharacterized spore protein YtfJ